LLLALAPACSTAEAPPRAGDPTPAGVGGPGVDADPCAPEEGGIPEVLLGTGEDHYEDLDDLEVLPLDTGSQGGQHVWMAVRARNLRQPSIIELSAHVPDLHRDLLPSKFPATLDLDPASGYCELAGIAYRVDVTTSVSELYGKILEVRVEIFDGEQTGEDLRLITLPDAVEP
jgi:hypothetical protein